MIHARSGMVAASAGAGGGVGRGPQVHTAYTSRFTRAVGFCTCYLNNRMTDGWINR